MVDDDEALLVTTSAVLLREGYEVRTARDGFEALNVLRGSIPDLMISDLTMPNMSGFELLAIVRKRFPGMAVIALSGEFAPISTSLVVADRFLRKGNDSPRDLKEAIRELLSHSPIREVSGAGVGSKINERVCGYGLRGVLTSVFCPDRPRGTR